MSISLSLIFLLCYLSYFVLSSFETADRLTGKGRLNFMRNNRFFRIQDRAIMKSFKTLTDEMNLSAPWNAPAMVWNLAWTLNQRLLPMLHFFDRFYSWDSSYNLIILWCKAIAANRRGSILWDMGITFDLLPPFFRWIVQFPLCWLYPNLHHQNVALRTAFLDQALTLETSDRKCEVSDKVRVIVLGAGYDSRSLRFLNNNKRNQSMNFFEFDLPSVIETKRLMLERFVRRRSGWRCQEVVLPSLLGVDLNDLESVRSSFILMDSQNISYSKTIIIVEAVLMYLRKDVVQSLLDVSVRAAKASTPTGEVSLCFADRFPGILDVDYNGTKSLTAEEEMEAVKRFLSEVGLKLTRWRPKPGRARHMGIATLSQDFLPE